MLLGWSLEKGWAIRCRQLLCWKNLGDKFLIQKFLPLLWSQHQWGLTWLQSFFWHAYQFITSNCWRIFLLPTICSFQLRHLFQLFWRFRHIEQLCLRWCRGGLRLFGWQFKTLAQRGTQYFWRWCNRRELTCLYIQINSWTIDFRWMLDCNSGGGLGRQQMEICLICLKDLFYLLRVLFQRTRRSLLQLKQSLRYLLLLFWWYCATLGLCFRSLVSDRAGWSMAWSLYFGGAKMLFLFALEERFTCRQESLVIQFLQGYRLRQPLGLHFLFIFCLTLLTVLSDAGIFLEFFDLWEFF